jgi:hypothetical protein
MGAVEGPLAAADTTVRTAPPHGRSPGGHSGHCSCVHRLRQGVRGGHRSSGRPAAPGVPLPQRTPHAAAGVHCRGRRGVRRRLTGGMSPCSRAAAVSAADMSRRRSTARGRSCGRTAGTAAVSGSADTPGSGPAIATRIRRSVTEETTSWSQSPSGPGAGCDTIDPRGGWAIERPRPQPAASSWGWRRPGPRRRPAPARV